MCQIKMLVNLFYLSLEESSKSKNNFVIPMVMERSWRFERLLQLKNEGKLDEEELAQLRSDTLDGLKNKTGSSVDADYDSVPIEMFGLALLRGCGWREGEGIGKTNKRVVPLRTSHNRPKGIGLGMEVSMTKQIDKNSSAKKSNVLKNSSFVKITKGIYRNLYGKVASFDEDNASVIVQLDLNGKNVRVSQYALFVVNSKEYERETKNFSNGVKHFKDNVRREECEMSMLLKKDHKNKKCETINHVSKQEMWAQPELKVRFINEKFKDGKLYKKKVRIVDASDRENCIVEDCDGNTYYQINECWLETVIPKAKGGRLMIVNGPYRGSIAVMETRDKKKHTVIARLISTEEIVIMSFDDVCEYLGEIDDLL
ncbi:unnamed protein product [Thelazia callipaeda]|uniref:G-patch domain-containing protein n=1 Tax=Thelazia callipaeda TaxID=103827 RepID=A0A158RCB0_THECL|nr:unnamed protein product [Thelazia callipaeda]